MKFEDFSIVSRASRVKTEAQLNNLSPAQKKKAEQKKEEFRRLTLRLSSYQDRVANPQQKEYLTPVLDALRSLTDSPSFEPDRRDKDFIVNIQRLLNIKSDTFEDIRIRYRTDCNSIAGALTERQYNIQKYNSSHYKLNRKEKAERKARLEKEETEKNYALAEASIEEYRSQIEDSTAKAAAIKRKISETADDTRAAQYLREYKAIERYIGQRNNLIELNRRIMDTVHNERFQSEKEKLLSKIDTKRQIKLIAEAQKLYRKERLVSGILNEVNGQIDAMSNIKIGQDELNEVREMKAAQKQKEKQNYTFASPAVNRSAAAPVATEEEQEQAEIDELLT